MKPRQQGAAIVEFAMILPLLLLLTMVTAEFGRAIYQYNAIVKSLRGAVRYLSVQTPNTHITEAKNLVVHGNIAGSGPVLVTGLSVSNVNTPVWEYAGTNPPIYMVSLTVSNYTFRSLFSSVFGVTFGNVTFNAIKAGMRSST